MTITPTPIFQHSDIAKFVHSGKSATFSPARVSQLIVVMIAATCGCVTTADTGIQIDQALTPAPRPLCGRLSEYRGLPVLELWGTPEQAGYAHGYLLAESIVSLIDGYMLDPKIMPNPQVYETLLIPAVHRQFVWTAAQESELAAMTDGMRARLGSERLRSKMLERALKLDDLMAANVLADWFGMMCSSFSAWGALTADGQTLTARNLDFPSTDLMARLQLVVIRHGYNGEKATIGVSWPGLIGIYTGMNSAGISMLMHDAAGLPPSENIGFTPRSLILREALTRARAGHLAGDALEVFQKRRVIVGNNIHVSAPRTPGLPPAVVFEYDANGQNQGVTKRGPQTSGNAPIDAVWCTNHMRLRKAPRECWRYQQLEESFARLKSNAEKLTPATALELIRGVAQNITLHSVCIVPHTKTMYILVPAVDPQTVEFKLDEWLRRPTERPQQQNQNPPTGGRP